MLCLEQVYHTRHTPTPGEETKHLLQVGTGFHWILRVLFMASVGARAVCTGIGKKRMTRKSEIPRMRRRRVAMTLGRVLTRMFHLFVPNNSSGNFFLAAFLRIHSPRPSNRAPPFYTDVLYGRCIQGCSNKHEKFFNFT